MSHLDICKILGALDVLQQFNAPAGWVYGGRVALICVPLIGIKRVACICDTGLHLDYNNKNAPEKIS